MPFGSAQPSHGCVRDDRAERQGQRLRQFARSCRQRAHEIGADRKREEERGRMGLVHRPRKRTSSSGSRRRQQDEREVLSVQILRETISMRPERHSGTPRGARNREEADSRALQKHPADVKARLQQEMPSTLRSIAEKETSEAIQIVRQEEAYAIAWRPRAPIQTCWLKAGG